MSKSPEMNIVRIGMVTPVGLSAPATAAAIRAGIARFRETPFFDNSGASISMGLVPEQFFDSEAMASAEEDPCGDDFCSARTSRIVRLGAAAVRQCLQGIPSDTSLPLLWVAPEPLPDLGEEEPDLLERLARRLGPQLDKERSQLFPFGRAGGALALQEAMARLTSGAAQQVLVGGADSYFDPELLLHLDARERLRSEEPRDAMVIGEGAACLLLEAAQASRIARLIGVGSADEPGHLYGETPGLCAGLDTAIKSALRAAAAPAIDAIYCSLNGESQQGREWGVALIRNRAAFSGSCQLHHPFDCIGDVGAASMPLLIGVAALCAQRARREHQTLIWCASDCAKRGAALLAA